MKWYKDFESCMFEPHGGIQFERVSSQRLEGAGWIACLESRQYKNQDVVTIITLCDDYGNCLERWNKPGLLTAEALDAIQKECEERYALPRFIE